MSYFCSGWVSEQNRCFFMNSIISYIIVCAPKKPDIQNMILGKNTYANHPSELSSPQSNGQIHNQFLEETNKIQLFSITSSKFVRWVLKIAFIGTSEHLCEAQPERPTQPSVLSFQFCKRVSAIYWDKPKGKVQEVDSTSSQLDHGYGGSTS